MPLNQHFAVSSFLFFQIAFAFYRIHFEHHELANNLVKDRVKILNDNQNYNEIVTLDTVWDGIEIGLKAA